MQIVPIEQNAGWPAQSDISPDGPAAAAAILVVDDEPFVAEELAEGLMLRGYEVMTANSAAAALESLAAAPAIRVMVTDIRMPGTDGLSLARAVLSSRPAAQAVEVVLITGHASAEDAAAGRDAGAIAFVRKPFLLDEIEQAVVRALARAAERRDGAGPAGG
jgi:DNA-binding NtrC family response regulator